MGESTMSQYAVWLGTDSFFAGTIQSRFTKQNGKEMVVLEDDRGLLHVYPVNDRLVLTDRPPTATALALRAGR